MGRPEAEKSLTGAAVRARRTEGRTGLVFFAIFLLAALAIGAAAVFATLAEGTPTTGAIVVLVVVPGGFVLAGVLGLRFAYRRMKAPDRAAERKAAAGVLPAPGPRAKVVLSPALGPAGKVAAIAVVALFWNGVVGAIGWGVLQTFRKGDPDWFPALFLIPFVLVGLALAGAVFYLLLALANPRPRVRLDPGAIPLGRSANAEWELTGRADRISRLKLTLEGREEATYRRGTDTVTAKSIFFRKVLGVRERAQAVQRGAVTLAVPDWAMHTFNAPNNKIAWVLQIHGEIPFWPDLDEELSIEVLPAEDARR